LTELPEDVARELEELFGSASDIPDNAITVRQLAEEKGGSTTQWSLRLKKLVRNGTWQRGRRVNHQAYWYWPIGGKDDEEGN